MKYTKHLPKTDKKLSEELREAGWQRIKEPGSLPLAVPGYFYGKLSFRRRSFMHGLTKLIRQDMRPALGVTEPAAIAFSVAAARRHAPGIVRRVTLRLNSGIYKNAFTCGIPSSDELGNFHAAALGAVGADPEKGLECLKGISPEQAESARAMVKAGKIRVEMSEISSRIFIEATVESTGGSACVTIRDAHTKIVRITENGRTVFEKESAEPSGEESSALIHSYTLEQLHDYALSVPLEEIRFIQEAFQLNYALCEAGLSSRKTRFSRYLLEKNGGRIISEDEQRTASLLCNAAIEARVLGLPEPAMSITGSGAHGIIATMPLYAAVKVRGYSEEQLLRATALSFLVCMYIKEYSGKLSAFCGCAIAAGTGMACGLVLLRGGSTRQMAECINNMAGSITGMICDGGNQGCTMKGVVAVDAVWQSVEMAMQDVFIDSVHGINAVTPEETMRNMGYIASPGMVGTEKTIVDILRDKRME